MPTKFCGLSVRISGVHLCDSSISFCAFPDYRRFGGLSRVGLKYKNNESPYDEESL